MNLFIDTISSTAFLAIFDENKNIITTREFIIKWNESSLLIPEIDSFLKENNLEYSDLENIVTVAWPWSFTWIRTTILVVNSINFLIKKNLTSLNFFDLYSNYPIIKQSSKRDSFIKKSNDSNIETMINDDILEYLNTNEITTVYWDYKQENIKTFEKPDYSNIINKIKLDNKSKIEPIYLKKPNIF